MGNSRFLRKVFRKIEYKTKEPAALFDNVNMCTVAMPATYY